MRVAVILSTYNQPEHLRRVLAGYLRQQRLPDELVIADDGSGEPTAAVVREHAAVAPYPVSHFNHADAGWNKNAIVNRAIGATEADYMILSDGDCIPRPDFILAHLRNARPGRFLSGGDFRLPPEVTGAISMTDIADSSIFNVARLRQLGLSSSRRTGKLTAGPILGPLLDALNFSRARWGGSNASTWRTALLEVNGLDERFSFPGKDDVEMGIRLRHLGLDARHIRHQAICLHLDHGKGYWRYAEMQKNLNLLADTTRSHRIKSPVGIAEARTPFTVARFAGSNR